MDFDWLFIVGVWTGEGRSIKISTISIPVLVLASDASSILALWDQYFRFGYF